MPMTNLAVTNDFNNFQLNQMQQNYPPQNQGYQQQQQQGYPPVQQQQVYPQQGYPPGQQTQGYAEQNFEMSNIQMN